mmetsp:Transcript_13715/g.30321  ORF Transcript_13715/g.30321 Transcript_13715/m.30321 type:complete len:85 (-) Transcript_13715:353-607(-)
MCRELEVPPDFSDLAVSGVPSASNGLSPVNTPLREPLGGFRKPSCPQLRWKSPALGPDTLAELWFEDQKILYPDPQKGRWLLIP